ncbi:neuropeptide B-like [Scomber japonicus]|uniref:neuropeptide B-like n=1 Tax=Scomber japonicus TaxID=13676 RepID=UPI00230544B9|nr:neuropeptide B-like [Scomber japonicus]
MEIPAKLMLTIVVISVLVACSPTEAWYRQVSGPIYSPVGRASGLLSGIQYVRRAESDPPNSVLPEITPQSFLLKSMHICIKDITPDLQSCELFQEIKGSFKCKADVFLSVDPSDCAGD